MPKTKSIIYKKEYSEGDPVPDLNVNEIGELLIDANKIPHFLDYELVTHDINFRFSREETRNDIIYHYVDILPILRGEEKEEEYNQFAGFKYRDTITKVDIVSFFTNPKDGKFEHHIYQIGRKYGSDDLSLNDLFGLGELNYEIQDYDKAIKFYSQALEYEPDDVDILISLGLAYIGKSEYGKAIKLFKKALEIERDYPLIWDNLGIAYEYNQEYEKAKDAYQKAFNLDPDDSEIIEHLKEIERKGF